MKQMWSKEEIEKVSKATPKDITTLVDSAGNPRFIEGEGSPLEQEGVTNTYCKWSLSGTHLMLVYAGTLEDTITISSNAILASFTLPSWILNKIYPVWDQYLDFRQASAYASGGTSQYISMLIGKTSSGIQLVKNGNLTLTAKRSFRIQFDLLIDAE